MPRHAANVRSALLGPGGETADQEALGGEEQDDDRKSQDDRSRHQHGRGNLDASRQLRQTERDRPRVALLDEEEQREQELVPRDHEDEQSVRHQRRHRQRKADPPHRLEPAASVDGRRFFERDRNGREVVPQRVDRHRGDLRDVDDHESHQGPPQSELREEDEQRHGEKDRREEVDREEQARHLAAPEELKPAHGVRARDRDQERQHDGAQRDQQRVPHEDDEALAAVRDGRQHLDVRREVELFDRDPQRAGILQQRLERAEAHQDHVIEGEDGHDQQQRDDDGLEHREEHVLEAVAADATASRAWRGGLPQRGGGHACSSCRPKSLR
jgi:hypothetical protein